MAWQAISPHDRGTVTNIRLDPFDRQLLAVLRRQPIDDRRYLRSRRSAVGENKNQRGLVRHRQSWGRLSAAGR